MTDEDILKIARELNIAPPLHLLDFAHRILAASAEGQEPVELYPCGFKKLNSLVIETGAFLARGINEDEPVTEGIRSAAMQLVGYARDMSSLLAKQPIYLHPAPIPEGMVLVPKSAMDWLMGLGDDFEPDRKGAYWWRSKFRELIAAATEGKP